MGSANPVATPARVPREAMNSGSRNIDETTTPTIRGASGNSPRLGKVATGGSKLWWEPGGRSGNAPEARVTTCVL